MDETEWLMESYARLLSNSKMSTYHFSAQWAKTEHKITTGDEKNVGKLKKVPAYIWTLFSNKAYGFQ